MKIISEKEGSVSTSEIGGKANGLLLLRQNSFEVPTFFLLEFETITEIKKQEGGLESILLDWKIDNNVNDCQLWAVRSSAAMEDGKEKSFAGQFLTKTNVATVDLKGAILDVLDSYILKSEYAEVSKSYGIIIQRMIKADYSGVLFSKDPVQLLKNNSVITIIPGMGEKLVSGEFDGFEIRYNDGAFIFDDLESEIGGETFHENQRMEVTKKGRTIKEETEPFLQELIDGAIRLERVIDAPTDIEFAIENGKVYWLQLRPMTNRSLTEKLIIWDNTNAEGNYPELTLPLSISFTQITFEGAYSASTVSIGFKRRILDVIQKDIENMSGGINGSLYYNVSAWQSNLYQMPFGKKFVHLLPRIWGMADAPFVPPAKRHSLLERVSIFSNLSFKLINSKKYERLYDKNIQISKTKFREKSIESLTYDELIKSYWDLRNRSAENWLAPILNGFYTMLIFFRLKRYIRKSKLTKSHPNFLNDILFAEGDVVSVKLVRSFQNLLGEINNNETLKVLFESNTPLKINEELKVNYQIFYDEIMLYIDKYGERTSESELKMETVNYKQDSILFIEYLKTNARGFVPNVLNGEAFDCHKVLKSHYPYNFIKRFIFKKLIAIAIRRVKARENFRFTRTQVFGLFRQLFLQMGDRLVKDGIIDTRRDVLYLKVDELIDHEQQNIFRNLISRRKDEYIDFAELPIAVRYVQSEKGLFEAIDDSVIAERNQLKGIGCCSGTVEGRVVLIDKNTDFNQDFTDCILVSHYFEPGWISLFSQAKGIISERGNLLSHTSIICRELNVPSIVGVKGLISAINDKKSLKMNGATGIVYLDLNE